MEVWSHVDKVLQNSVAFANTNYINKVFTLISG